MSRAATEFRYEKLTWPEINDAIGVRKVCLVPCGAVEQHGAHLPLDVDIACPTGGHSRMPQLFSTSTSSLTFAPNSCRNASSLCAAGR